MGGWGRNTPERKYLSKAYITKIINTILLHMWTCVVVTSTDLKLNGLQPTTPRDNLAVSKAVFIADVIFETTLFM